MRGATLPDLPATTLEVLPAYPVAFIHFTDRLLRWVTSTAPLCLPHLAVRRDLLLYAATPGTLNDLIFRHSGFFTALARAGWYLYVSLPLFFRV